MAPSFLEMSDKTIVYILGAGASAANGAPLTKELLWNAIITYWSTPQNKATLQQKILPALKHADKICGTDLANITNEAISTGILPAGQHGAYDIDVEGFLTQIEESVSGEQDRLFKQEVFYFIFHPLCYRTNNIPQNELRHYTTFVENVLKKGTRHCIITFNYDVLLERTMCDAKKYFENGYTNQIFNANSVNRQRIPWTYGINFCEVEWKGYPYRPENTFAEIFLLKLHGSFNWGLCPFTGEVKMYAPVGDFDMYERLCNGKRTCHLGKHSCQPLLIPPTIEKNLGIPALQIVWEQAKDFLSQATELHVIGYSAPEADKGAQELFVQALKPRVSKLEKVVLANKSANTRIKGLLGITNCEEYNTFEEYLKKYEFSA